MSRISKENAHKAALAISKKLLDSRVKKENELSELVTDIVAKSIPKDVMSCFDKHSGNFYTKSYVQLNGNGFNWEQVALTKKLPLTNSAFNINAADAKKAIKISHDITDLSVKYKTTIKEIECSILALGTHNRVKEQFPEALPFLPDGVNTCTAVAINLQPIRKTVKSLTS